MKYHFRRGASFNEFLDQTQENREIWHRIHRRAQVTEDILSLARKARGPLHLLALGEDWCMDSTNVLPYVARLAEALAGIDMRVLRKDSDPELMERHLTDGGEAIPVVIILDEEYREVGWWGPRPALLQAFFDEELGKLSEDVRLFGLRGWYRRDGGKTALTELVKGFPGVRQSCP